MFRVIVTKRIYLDSEKGASVLLKREVELPFAPYIGLVMAEGLWEAGPLVRVCWLIGDRVFSCTVADVVPERYSAHTGEELVEFDLAEGWCRNT